ncbi:DNA repair protein RecO [Geobacter sp. DSM 9736]|uniref:DNA repair protein RecO n=1 Tax=Geobacter sp. DSM 9736 TaxID=1277350 RepID=UPI000B500E4D|nr:DNA repair protein RecO [Geobacter sp. DSM 9736]SNB46714.1 DNA replication and repair protein RecO [Geobacter sp. DSM 9736]
MEVVTSEAVVLRLSDYRESDKLVTLFCREHGKIRGIARGAKRSARRFGGTLELFARINVQLVLREGLSSVREADALTVYPQIRDDLPKIGCAGYACELVDALLPEGLPNPRLYRLLIAYLERLEIAEADGTDRRFFEINLLNILGYRPALDNCSGCGTDLVASAARLGGNGAILCGRCSTGGRLLSSETLTLLGRALRTGRFGVVAFSPSSLEEAGRLLDAAIAAHLGRPLRSLAFLRELGE